MQPRNHSRNIRVPHVRRIVQATAIEPVVWAAVERALNNPALIAAELERRREGTSAQQATWTASGSTTTANSPNVTKT